MPVLGSGLVALWTATAGIISSAGELPAVALLSTPWETHDHDRIDTYLPFNRPTPSLGILVRLRRGMWHWDCLCLMLAAEQVELGSGVMFVTVALSATARCIHYGGLGGKR
jgi:hypothetical protein